MLADAYFGAVQALVMERRGLQSEATNIDNDRILVRATMPLSEVVVDFYDELKSLTSGYASFDYEDAGYETTNLSKVIRAWDMTASALVRHFWQ